MHPTIPNASASDPLWIASGRLRTATSASVLAGISLACASYPERTAEALGDFQRGQLSRSLAAYEHPETTNSRFLAGAEAGTVALAAGDWDGAVRNLSKAADAVEEIEDSALISPESLGQALVSWTLSEASGPYRGEGFERVLVHAGLALAYLAKGDLESAQVEVRRSDALLESEEKLYEKEYKAGGLGHFISAVSYELDNKPDEAWIDYQRLRKKGLGGELAARALARLARKMHREEELDEESARFADAEPEGSASVVVIAGIGLGPFKREGMFFIPTPDGLLKWSVPDYVSRPQTVEALEVSVTGGDKSVRTVVVEDVDRVAEENLEDRIVWLAAKSTVRTFLKRELTQHLEKEAGLFGRIAGDVFSFVTERADLRSWNTLPATWQAARVFLPPGPHDLRVRAVGGAEQSLGAFELEAGETMFVFARTIDGKLYAYPVGGKPCPVPEVRAAP